jgi:hypothetical protein
MSVQFHTISQNISTIHSKFSNTDPSPPKKIWYWLLKRGIRALSSQAPTLYLVDGVYDISKAAASCSGIMLGTLPKSS